MYPKRTKSVPLEASTDEMQQYIASRRALNLAPARPATSDHFTKSPNPLAPIPARHHQQQQQQQQPDTATCPITLNKTPPQQFTLTQMLPSANRAHKLWQDRIQNYRDAAALLDKASTQQVGVPFTPWMQSTLATLQTQLQELEGRRVLVPHDHRSDFRHNDEDNDGWRAGGAHVTSSQQLDMSAGSSPPPLANSPTGKGLAGARALAKLTNQHNAAWEQDEATDVVQRPHPLRSAVAVAILQRLFVSFNLPTSLWRDVLSLVFDSNCANDILSRDYQSSNSISGYLERRFLCDTVKRLEAERIDLATLNHVAVGQLNKLHDYTLVERQVADGARLRMTFAAWRSLKYLSAWRKIAMKLRLDRRSTMWMRRCFDAWKGFVVIEQLHAEVDAEKRAAKDIVISSQQQIEEGQNALRQQLLEERKEHERQLNEIKSKKIMSQDALVEIEQLREMVTTYKQDQRSYERRVKDLELIVKEQAQLAQLAEERSRRCLHALKRTALLMVGTRVMNGIKASDIIVNARGIGTSSQFRFSSNDGVDTITAAANLPSPALSAGMMQQNMSSKHRHSMALGGGGISVATNAGSPTSNTKLGDGGSSSNSNSAANLLKGLPRVGSHIGSLEMASIVSASTNLGSGVHLTSILCSFVNGVIQRHREQQRDALLTAPQSLASTMSSPMSPMSRSRGAANIAANAALLFPGITNITAAFADGRYYVQLIEIVFGPTCPLVGALQTILNGCQPQGSDSNLSAPSQAAPATAGYGSGPLLQPTQSAAFVRSQASISDFGKHREGSVIMPLLPFGGGPPLDPVRSALVVEQLFAMILLHLDETIRHYAQYTAKVRQREAVRELMRKPDDDRLPLGTKGTVPPGLSAGDLLSEEEEVLLTANEVVFSHGSEDILPPSARRGGGPVTEDLVNETLQGTNNYMPSITGQGGATSPSLPKLGDLHARLLETPFVVRDFTEATRPLHAAAHYYLVICLLKCYSATKMIPLPQWRADFFSAETPAHTIPIDVSSLPSMAKAHPGPERDDRYRQLKEQERKLFDTGFGALGTNGEKSIQAEEADAHEAELSVNTVSQSQVSSPRQVIDATTAADALSTCVVLAQSSINAWSVLSQYAQEAYFFAFKSVFVLAGVPIVKVFSGMGGLNESVHELATPDLQGTPAATRLSGHPLRASTTTVEGGAATNASHTLSVDSSDAESMAETTASEKDLGAVRRKKSKRSKRRASFMPEVEATSTPYAHAHHLKQRRNSAVGFSVDTAGPSGDLAHVQDRNTFGHTNDYVSLIRNTCLEWCEDQSNREAVELGTLSSTMSPSARRFVFSPAAVISSINTRRISIEVVAPLAGLSPSSRQEPRGSIEKNPSSPLTPGGYKTNSSISSYLSSLSPPNVPATAASVMSLISTGGGQTADTSATQTLLEVLFRSTVAPSVSLVETFICYDLPLSSSMLDSLFTYALSIAAPAPSTTTSISNTMAGNHRASLLLAAANTTTIPATAHSDVDTAILTHRQWALLLSALGFFGLVPAVDDSRKGNKSPTNSNTAKVSAQEAAMLRQSLEVVSRSFSLFSPREGLTPKEFAMALMHVAITHFSHIIHESEGWVGADATDNSTAKSGNPFISSNPPSGSPPEFGRKGSLAFVSRSRSLVYNATAQFDDASGDLLAPKVNDASPLSTASTQYKVPKPSQLLLYVFLQTRIMPILQTASMTVFVPASDTRLQLRALKNAMPDTLSLSSGPSPLGTGVNWQWLSMGLGASIPSAPLAVTELHFAFAQFRTDLKPLWEKFSNEGVNMVIALAKSSGSALAHSAAGGLLGGSPSRKGHLSSMALKGMPPPGSSADLKSRASNAQLIGLPQSPSEGVIGGSAAVQFYNSSNQFAAFIDSAMAPLALWVHQAKVQATAQERELAASQARADNDDPAHITVEAEGAGGKQMTKKSSAGGKKLSGVNPSTSLLASSGGPSSGSLAAHFGRNEAWITGVIASKGKGHVTVAERGPSSKGAGSKSPQSGADALLPGGGKKSLTALASAAQSSPKSASVSSTPIGIMCTSPAGYYSGIPHAVGAFLAFIKKESAAAELALASLSPLQGGQGSSSDLAASGIGIARTSSIANNNSVRRTNSTSANPNSLSPNSSSLSAANYQVVGYAATLRRPDVIRTIVTSVASSIVSRDVPAEPPAPFHDRDRSQVYEGPDHAITANVADIVAEADEALFRLRQESCQFEAFCDMCVMLAMVLWPAPMYQDAARLRLFIIHFASTKSGKN